MLLFVEVSHRKHDLTTPRAPPPESRQIINSRNCPPVAIAKNVPKECLPSIRWRYRRYRSIYSPGKKRNALGKTRLFSVTHESAGRESRGVILSATLLRNIATLQSAFPSPPFARRPAVIDCIRWQMTIYINLDNPRLGHHHEPSAVRDRRVAASEHGCISARLVGSRWLLSGIYLIPDNKHACQYILKFSFHAGEYVVIEEFIDTSIYAAQLNWIENCEIYVRDIFH